jgi:hypothetical protein
MCPTELLHDPSRPPSIRLLPIETRLNEATVTEFKNYADEWVTFPLDLAAAERMAETLARVSQVKRVPIALARKYGLFSERDDDILSALERGDEGSVDIPCWRHAEINFPHPLLQQGLIILDTPGLNAIGTEPELTLNLLPNAHAVLFLLSADAGVTKTDLDVWNAHLAGEEEATNRHPQQDRRPVGRAQGRRRDQRGNRSPGRRKRRDARHLACSGVRRVGAEGARREGERGRRALDAKPPAGARAFAVEKADSR